MAEKITFQITPEGMTFDSEGFKGGKCLSELKDFENYLKNQGGIEVNMTNQVKKPELFATEQKNQAKW